MSEEQTGYDPSKPWTKGSRFYRAGLAISICSFLIVIGALFVYPDILEKALQNFTVVTTTFMLGAGGRSVVDRIKGVDR